MSTETQIPIDRQVNYQVELFTWTRQNILELLKSVSALQALSIPKGFRNNLLWNAGHVVWAQQVLVYHLAGLPTQMPEGFDKQFGTGTVPEPGATGTFSLQEVTRLLEEGVEQTLLDIEEKKFKHYTPFSASYDHVEYHFTEWLQAFQYNNIHEARHYGVMVGLRQCV